MLTDVYLQVEVRDEIYEVVIFEGQRVRSEEVLEALWKAWEEFALVLGPAFFA
jgi:hypothetical protein